MMAEREDEKYLNMREFSRVDAQLPLEVRRVPQAERSSVRSKLSGETVLTEMRTLPDLEDKHLTDWLKMLNAKLDAMISMLTFQREGFCSMSFTHVNISGSGMSFLAHEKYAPGELLELKMMLPMVPPVALYVYGEVVKAEARASSYVVAVKFVAMDEEIQDEIVKFVFKRQRDILREKRK